MHGGVSDGRVSRAGTALKHCPKSLHSTVLFAAFWERYNIFFFPERVFLPNTTSHRTQLHPPIPQRPGAGEGAELGSHGQALWPRGTPTGQQLFVGRAVFLGDFQESSTRPGLSLTDESCAFPRNLWCWQSCRPSPSPGRPQPHPRRSHPDHRLGGQGHRLRYRGSQHEGEGEVQDQGWGAVAGGRAAPSQVSEERASCWGIQEGGPGAVPSKGQTVHACNESGHRESGEEQEKVLG